MIKVNAIKVRKEKIEEEKKNGYTEGTGRIAQLVERQSNRIARRWFNFLECQENVFVLESTFRQCMQTRTVFAQLAPVCIESHAST